jgi:hypothetical protein
MQPQGMDLISDIWCFQTSVFLGCWVVKLQPMAFVACSEQGTCKTVHILIIIPDFVTWEAAIASDVCWASACQCLYSVRGVADVCGMYSLFGM